MEKETLEDLKPEVATEALPIREKLQQSGWQIGVIHWAKKDTRTIRFNAKSPSGASYFVSCEESDLPTKLRSPLDSN